MEESKEKENLSSGRCEDEELLLLVMVVVVVSMVENRVTTEPRFSAKVYSHAKSWQSRTALNGQKN